MVKLNRRDKKWLVGGAVVWSSRFVVVRHYITQSNAAVELTPQQRIEQAFDALTQ
jgi:hypothetical protein